MKKILLIDDDPDVRHVMSLMLKKEGYDVDTASNKEEAMERLSQKTPSLILLDVLLSGSDGRDLCREIKAAEETKDVPIIIFSGHPGAATQFETCGAVDFMAKPINSEVLLKKLRIQTKAVK
jgi:DNA-binding response OmpR family regulator